MVSFMSVLISPLGCKRRSLMMWACLLLCLSAAPASAQTFYTISFNPNGGVGFMADTIVAQDSLFEVPPCAYTREGYDFIGWAVDTATNDSTLIAYPATSQVHIIVTHQFTLYAVWRSNCTDQYDSLFVSACGSYVWNATGDTLHTSGVHTLTAAGVVPGECDSIYSLLLTILPTYNIVDTLAGCDSVLWNANMYYANTQESMHFTSVDGCDSNRILQLTIYHAFYNLTTTSVCDSFYWSSTGLYYYHDTLDTKHYQTAAGCDSIINNYIFIHPSFRHDTVAVVCDSFFWHVTASVYRHDTNVVAAYLTPYLCDSVYSLHLSVPQSFALIDTVVGCDSLFWSGPLVAGGGLCYLSRTTDTSVVQMLTTSAGCDSTVSLLLDVSPSYFQTDIHTVCDTFYWVAGHQLFTADADTTVSFLTAAGCDSSFALQLTVGHSLYQHDVVTACDSFFWAAGQRTFYADAIDTAAFVSQQGCDSIFSLQLDVNNSYSLTDTVSRCDSYLWLPTGMTYTHDTIVSLPLLTSGGCDSSLALILTINPSYQVNENLAGCDSVYSPFLQQTFLTNTVVNVNSQTVDGCDSTLHINLAVHPSFHQMITPVVCDSFYWTMNGVVYTSSQQVEWDGSTMQGCDSTYVLNLTVNPSREADVYETECDSLYSTTTNRFYFSSTNEDFMTHTTAGCDSLIHLHVTINHSSVVDVYDTICEDDSYAFNGQNYSTAGVYYYRDRTTTGCDSIIALHLAVWNKPDIAINLNYDCETGYYYIQAASGAPYYAWSADPVDPSLAGQEHNANINVKPTRDTRYVLLNDYYSVPTCGSTKELVLKPVVKPSAQMEVSPENLSNDNMRFHAIDRSHNASSRTWYVDGVYVTDEPNLWYTADPSADSVVVMLEASSATCLDTTWHTFYVYRDMLYIPNAFTPDESTNNTFFVQGTGTLSFELYIYNRGGQLVFSADNIDAQWDGTGPDGQPCPQGVYVYLVKYVGASMPEMPQVRKGSVLLLR